MVPPSSGGTPRGCRPGRRGRSARPPCPPARPPRCPVPGARRRHHRPRRRWLGTAGSRSSHPGTEALARSLTPRPPRRAARRLRPGDAARPPPRPPPSPRPPRASHGLRCAPAIGGRPAARPARPARCRWPPPGTRGPAGLARLTRGRRRVKRAPAAGRLLNPLGAAACSPLPPPPTNPRSRGHSPGIPPRSGADEPLLHWHFFGAGGRGTLGSRGGP